MHTILGIGIDSVDIERFAQWHTYSHEQLARILSEQEIAYCLSTRVKSAERFAARFAAREALLKALGSAYPEVNIPLLTLSRHLEISKNSLGAPGIAIDWVSLIPGLENKPACHLSWTHTKHLATAIVILERSDKPHP